VCVWASDEVVTKNLGGAIYNQALQYCGRCEASDFVCVRASDEVVTKNLDGAIYNQALQYCGAILWTSPMLNKNV
jgi:hypothetical protein